jgi:hypothetical protein
VRTYRRPELAAGVEDVDERLKLSLQACQQLLSLGWRMGASDEETAAVFAEGHAVAERIGDRPALTLLVALYSAVRNFAGGSAVDYVRYGEEAGHIAAECDDPALRAAVWTVPMFAHYYAGNGLPTLAWSDRILAEVGSDNALGKTITGYSPRVTVFNGRQAALMYTRPGTEAVVDIGGVGCKAVLKRRARTAR